MDRKKLKVLDDNVAQSNPDEAKSFLKSILPEAKKTATAIGVGAGIFVAGATAYLAGGPLATAITMAGMSAAVGLGMAVNELTADDQQDENDMGGK